MTFHFGKRTSAGRTQNVSRGGLCAVLADAIPMGIDVDVDIVLVFEDEMQSEALRLPGRIVWCTAVDEAHQIGVSFRRLGAEQTEYLALFLGYLDNTKQDKAPRDLPIDDRFR